MEPESEQQTYLIFLMDILGFESKFRESGLRNIHKMYLELAAYVDGLEGGAFLDAWPVGEGGESAVFMGFFDLRHAYFSDTMLLWSPYHPRSVRPFLSNCNALFCYAIGLGFMVRGAVSVGEAILDTKASIFLGEPIIEAARVEQAQHWIGVALCRSFAQASSGKPVPWEEMLLYDKHIKPELRVPELGHYSPGLVLNWPQTWRKQQREPASVVIRAYNRDSRYSRYYEHTVEFIEFSEEHDEWTKKSGGFGTVYEAVTGHEFKVERAGRDFGGDASAGVVTRGRYR